ncbi:alpha/beta hydrolase (plasmid) [Priestia megaterium]|uniref:alpha/beta hydrolase n=1 Tax=Priestia megaterium TaxID=1404 RepID=UPI0035CA3C05
MLGKKVRFIVGSLLILGLVGVTLFLTNSNIISNASNVSDSNNSSANTTNNDRDVVRKTKINKVPKGKVNTNQVTFPNEKTGLKLAGLVFTPKNMKPNAKLPAVVVGGPMFSVKEQTQSLYAQHMAELGYVAIVFDHTYYGESEGEPRRYEDPFMKSEDIKSAVSYLETLPYVDTDQIGGLGICGSGSYMPFTAVSDHRIKAVASVVPWGDMNDWAISETLGPVLSPELAKEAREAYERGETSPDYTVFQPQGDNEGAAYYWNPKRGLVPNWVNTYVPWSTEKWAKFNPEEALSNLGPTPLLVITSSNAWSLSSAESLYAAANGPKKFYMIKGAGHFDLYDLDPYVTEAMKQIKPFFAKYLR